MGHHTERRGSSPIILSIVRGIKPANDSHLLGVEQQQATDWNYVISQFHCSRISTAATSTYHYTSTLHSLRVVIIAADKFYYPPNHSQSWFLNAHKTALCSVHVNSYVVIAASPKPEAGRTGEWCMFGILFNLIAFQRLYCRFKLSGVWEAQMSNNLVSKLAWDKCSSNYVVFVIKSIVFLCPITWK